MNRPPFQQFPELTSPRLLMRRLETSDAAFVLEIMVYNGKPAENISDAITMIEKIESDVQSGTSVNWVIVNRETNEPMGTIGYYRGFDNETGEIGFIMKPEFQGKGGNALLYYEMGKTVFGFNQFEHVEMTQVAETTRQMRADLRNLNGVEYKNHRVYRKMID